MGDVLVYAESPVNDRLLGFARPLAEAAGGDLVVLLARGEPGAEEAPAAADVVLEASRGALALSPRGTPGVLAAAIRARAPTVVLENTTAGLGSPPPPRRSHDGASYVGCVELRLEDGEAQSISGIYGGQLHATARTPLPAVVAVNTTALHTEPQAAGRGRRAQKLAPRPSWRHRPRLSSRSCYPDEGVDLTKAERIVCVGRGIEAPRTSRSRRSWPTPSAPSSGRRGR